MLNVNLLNFNDMTVVASHALFSELCNGQEVCGQVQTRHGGARVSVRQVAGANASRAADVKDVPRICSAMLHGVRL